MSASSREILRPEHERGRKMNEMTDKWQQEALSELTSKNLSKFDFISRVGSPEDFQALQEELQTETYQDWM